MVTAHDVMDDDQPPESAATTGVDVDDLQPFGLGWRWQWRSGRTKVRITFRGIRRTSSGPSAEVTIDVRVPSIGVGGTLTVERLSLGDGKGRVALANRLDKRTGEGPEAPVQWRALLDTVCSRILTASRAGPPQQTIGMDDEEGTRWMIQDLVEEHQTTSIYADGETGKSWLTLAACVSSMSGVEIVPGWVPTRRVVPLYLDWETDQEIGRAHV